MTQANHGYQRGYNTLISIHVATKLIEITSFSAWASETSGDTAAEFYFSDGQRGWRDQSYATYGRVLPVRSVK